MFLEHAFFANKLSRVEQVLGGVFLLVEVPILVLGSALRLKNWARAARIPRATPSAVWFLFLFLELAANSLMVRAVIAPNESFNFGTLVDSFPLVSFVASFVLVFIVEEHVFFGRLNNTPLHLALSCLEQLLDSCNKLFSAELMYTKFAVRMLLPYVIANSAKVMGHFAFRVVGLAYVVAEGVPAPAASPTGIAVATAAKPAAAEEATGKEGGAEKETPLGFDQQALAAYLRANFPLADSGRWAVDDSIARSIGIGFLYVVLRSTTRPIVAQVACFAVDNAFNIGVLLYGFFVHKGNNSLASVYTLILARVLAAAERSVCAIRGLRLSSMLALCRRRSHRARGKSPVLAASTPSEADKGLSSLV